MTWLAPKLNKRIQIQTSVQTPGNFGTLDLTYNTVKTIWAEVKLASGISTTVYMMAVRGVNAAEPAVSHIIKVRSSALNGLGRENSKAFSAAFDSIEDLNMIKSNYFLFLQAGSSVKGRRFRIRGMRIDEANGEYVDILAEEMEEVGTGYA